MEIEAKFSVPNQQTMLSLLEAPLLAGYALGPASSSELRDTYLDTHGGAFLSNGFALRVRRDGERSVATLKGLGEAQGAIHRREEHEVELTGLLAPSRWPPGPLRDVVLRLSGSVPLVALFDIGQRRVTRRVHDGEREVADLSVDRVVVRPRPVGQPWTGDQAEAPAAQASCAPLTEWPVVGEAETGSHGYLELEVELLPDGTEHDLERLSAELCQRWQLAPERRSKFHRALADLPFPPAGPRFSATLTTVMPEPIRAHPAAAGSTGPAPKRPGVLADDLMSEAGRKILGFHLRRMLLHEPGTRQGTEIEALHDMRVATRRMRASFGIFQEYFDAGTIAPFLKALRRTGRRLGAVRDLDVFGEKVRCFLENQPELDRLGMDSFLSALGGHREAARRRLIGHLDGRDHGRFVASFSEFVDTPGKGCASLSLHGGDPRPCRVRHLAPVAVLERLAAVRAYEDWMSAPDVPFSRYHALRIAAKRLRYVLEFFSEVLGPESRFAIGRVVALQDHLGLLQDGVVATSILRDFLAQGTWGSRKRPTRESRAESPTSRAGAAAYLAARQSEMQDLIAGFPAVWRSVTEPEFVRAVVSAIAVL